MQADRTIAPAARVALVAASLLVAAPPSALAASQVLVDNDAVRASLNTYAPGEGSGEHEHRDPRFVYVLASGTLRSTDPSGTVSERIFHEGTCLYAAPLRHSVRNEGKTTVRLLEVELKGATGPPGGMLACPAQGEAFAASRPGGPGASVGSAPRAPRRSILLVSAELTASRVEMKSGTREPADPGRRGRFLFVLAGGHLASTAPDGARTLAGPGEALWIDGSAGLTAEPPGDLVLIEVSVRERAATIGHAPGSSPDPHVPAIRPPAGGVS